MSTKTTWSDGTKRSMGNAFDLSKREPTQFAREQHFSTPLYVRWQKEGGDESWDKFRRRHGAAGQHRVYKVAPGGHGDLPLGPLSEAGAKGYLERREVARMGAARG